MSASTKHAAIALTIATLLVASFYLVPTARNSIDAYYSVNHAVSHNGVVELGDQWHRDVELTHAADQYDCLESATKQLAAQLAEFVQDRQGLFKEPISVVVQFEGEHSLSDFPKRAMASLEQFLPLALLDNTQNLRVQLSSAKTSSDSNESRENPSIEVRLATLSVGSSNDSDPTAGSFILAGSIYCDQQIATLEPLQIATKDWIGQWSAFHDKPSNKRLRQYRAETIEQAQLLVARELASKWRGQRSNYHLVSGLSLSQAEKLIQQQSPQLDLIVDEFEQTFQLKMQDGSHLPALTRSALLVDLSSQKLDAVQRLLDASSQGQSERFWSRLRLFCPMAAVLMLATLGLDQLTLGYYTWRIRSGAVLIASVIFLLLV